MKIGETYNRKVVHFGKLDYRADGLIEYEISIKPNSAKLVL